MEWKVGRQVGRALAAAGSSGGTALLLSPPSAYRSTARLCSCCSPIALGCWRSRPAARARPSRGSSTRRAGLGIGDSSSCCAISVVPSSEGELTSALRSLHGHARGGSCRACPPSSLLTQLQDVPSLHARHLQGCRQKKVYRVVVGRVAALGAARLCMLQGWGVRLVQWKGGSLSMAVAGRSGSPESKQVCTEIRAGKQYRWKEGSKVRG